MLISLADDPCTTSSLEGESMYRLAVLFALIGPIPFGAFGREPDAQKSELQLTVDGPNGKAIPCRVHLSDSAGKPQQAMGLPFWKDHFVCDGRVAMALAPGRYAYEIERGPEWQRIAGSIDLTSGRSHTLHVQFNRLANVAQQGWY